MTARTRYTEDEFRKVVSESTSVADCIRKYGLRQTGGTQAHYKRLIEEWGIDTSHFTGQGWSKGVQFHARRISAEAVFAKTNTQAKQLRRALFEIGRVYECVWCGIEAMWNGKPLVIQIDHIDGNTENNNPDNLRFLCPNCHSQTENFGRKNKPMRG